MNHVHTESYLEKVDGKIVGMGRTKVYDHDYNLLSDTTHVNGEVIFVKPLSVFERLKQWIKE